MLNGHQFVNFGTVRIPQMEEMLYLVLYTGGRGLQKIWRTLLRVVMDHQVLFFQAGWLKSVGYAILSRKNMQLWLGLCGYVKNEGTVGMKFEVGEKKAWKVDNL